MSQSEVARLREQIELEYQAARGVFTGFTPTARHKYITARQQNIEACYEQLKQQIGPVEAMKVMIEAERAVEGDPHVSS